MTRTRPNEHTPGVFGIACYLCGKRIKTHETCQPNRSLNPARMHPLTGTLLAIWLVGASTWLMWATR